MLDSKEKEIKYFWRIRNRRDVVHHCYGLVVDGSDKLHADHHLVLLLVLKGTVSRDLLDSVFFISLLLLVLFEVP
jgi:hypothetical protein